MMDCRENLQKCHEYLKALEEERRKIEMFQRELPLCLEIVTQAIETCKQQLSATTTVTTTTTEHSEQTTSDGPVFEEFLPLKRARGGGQEEDDGEFESHRNSANFNDGSGKKSDWLRSVQLWNQSPDPPTSTTTKKEHQNNQPRKVSVIDVTTKGVAIHPFQIDNSDGSISRTTVNITTATASPAPPLAPAPAASACSTAERAAAGSCRTSKKDEDGKEGGQLQPRKARRCWSPELHKRFLNALEQLGGSQVATPKQIRELMKVDGLTNDEVKSHLQKYRLHSRRPTSAAHNAANTQAPQFVVVGGIWMPQQEYAAAGAANLGEATATITSAPPSGVYVPAAAPPTLTAEPCQATTFLAKRQQHQHQQSSRSAGSHSEGGVGRCNSPATSCSTHTITASAAY